MRMFSWIGKIVSFGRSGVRRLSLLRNAWGWAAGTIVNEDTAMKVAAYYRGKMYVATSIAKIPWDVKDSNNEVVEGTIYNLLNLAPNEETTAMMLKCWMISEAIDHGNSFCEIERNIKGEPIALWPLPTKDVTVVRLPYTGRLAYQVRGGSAQFPGEDVFLPPKDVFHLRNFHSKDSITGQGLIYYAINTLGISIAADEMAGNLFKNGGIPSGILSHPETLSEEAYQRLKKSWDEQQGGKKAGGTAILEEGTKYDPIQIDAQVLQFLESRKFGVLEIARFLGVPPTKLFDTTAATFDNVENANLEVGNDTLDAWCRNCELEADIKLLNNRHSGRYTDLSLYDVFRGDMTARMEYYTKLFSVAAITPNQIRSREGLPPYKGKGGDDYYLAANNYTPTKMVEQVVQSQIDKNKNPPAKTDNTPATPDKLANAVAEYLTGK